MVTVNTAFEDAKIAKKLAIDEARGRYFMPESIRFMNRDFDLTAETYRNLVAVTAFAALLGGVGDNFGWIDKTNAKVPMTTDELKEFILMIRNILEYGYFRSSELKLAVEAATVIEEVEAIPEW